MTASSVIRRAFDAFERRDADELGELFDDESEFRSVFLDGAEGASYRGRAGVDRYLADIGDAFGEWEVRELRLFDAEDGRVVALYRVIGAGRGSGVPIDLPMAIVWTLQGEKVRTGIVYLDQAEALRAAGIDPEEDQQEGT